MVADRDAPRDEQDADLWSGCGDLVVALYEGVGPLLIQPDHGDDDPSVEAMTAGVGWGTTGALKLSRPAAGRPGR
jgi:hypothetical protein